MIEQGLEVFSKLKNKIARKKPVLNWQRLKSKSGKIPDVYRTAIPGGWLLHQNGQALFIKDEEHLWDGNSLNIADFVADDEWNN